MKFLSHHNGKAGVCLLKTLLRLIRPCWGHIVLGQCNQSQCEVNSRIWWLLFIASTLGQLEIKSGICKQGPVIKQKLGVYQTSNVGATSHSEHDSRTSDCQNWPNTTFYTDLCFAHIGPMLTKRLLPGQQLLSASFICKLVFWGKTSGRHSNTSTSTMCCTFRHLFATSATFVFLLKKVSDWKWRPWKTCWIH